jgi:hypothetical protein
LEIELQDALMNVDSALERTTERAPGSAGKVVCRAIEAADLPAIIDMLQDGFPRRRRSYWEVGLQRLARYNPPPGFPQFGDLLEVGGRPVGVHLLISSVCTNDPLTPVRCNGSSWYVDGRFRSYGTFLVMRGTRRQPAVYTDIGPREHTLPIIAAQGFQLYSHGVFACIPALAHTRTEPARACTHLATWRTAGIPVAEQRLLADHEAFGCICLWCETPSGGQPVIVRRRIVHPGIPCAQLIYCRSISNFVEVARPVGRFLAARGMPLLLIAANEALRGVPGRLFPNRLPMYFKGAKPPTPSDLSYTEVALLGM